MEKARIASADEVSMKTLEPLARSASSLSDRIRGRIRLARGRCPACDSESRATASCGVCRGYTGPFPVEEGTLLRWSWRFQVALRPTPTPAPETETAVAWSPPGARLAR